jgi:general secretion pathway protein G
MNRIMGKMRVPGDRASASRGFTLFELMIVMTIIIILATIGAGRYEQAVVRAREAALRSNLQTMRKAIQDYTLDKEAGPQSLDDLVSGGYLREVPDDPMTRTKDWATDSDELLLSPEQTTSGITDVHSSSGEVSPSLGTAYSTW